MNRSTGLATMRANPPRTSSARSIDTHRSRRREVGRSATSGIITARVRRSALVFAKTGEVTGVPDDVPAQMMAAAVPEPAPGMLFKSRPGGARDAHPDPCGRSSVRAVRCPGRGPREHGIGVQYELGRVRLHTDGDRCPTVAGPQRAGVHDRGARGVRRRRISARMRRLVRLCWPTSSRTSSSRDEARSATPRPRATSGSSDLERDAGCVSRGSGLVDCRRRAAQHHECVEERRAAPGLRSASAAMRPQRSGTESNARDRAY